MATSLSQLAQAQFSNGELDAARETYAQSRDIFEEIDDTSRAAQVTVRLARIDVQASDLESAQQRVDEVLAVSLREALHEPGIQAMELGGDIAAKQGNSGRAIDAYEDTLRYIDETGFVVTRNRVTVKLANLLLDENKLAEAEPLIGYLIESGDSPSAFRVRARYAHLIGDTARAAELMELLRKTFADDWTEADAEVLERYRGSVGRDSR
jgi:tetratricopeptide (TPR) repeat protein